MSDFEFLFENEKSFFMENSLEYENSSPYTNTSYMNNKNILPGIIITKNILYLMIFQRITI